jgi:hypothetical protein
MHAWTDWKRLEKGFALLDKLAHTGVRLTLMVNTVNPCNVQFGTAVWAIQTVEWVGLDSQNGNLGCPIWEGICFFRSALRSRRSRSSAIPQSAKGGALLGGNPRLADCGYVLLDFLVRIGSNEATEHANARG